MEIEKNLFGFEEDFEQESNQKDVNTSKINFSDEDMKQIESFERFFDYTARNTKPMNFDKANSILNALEDGAIVPYNP